MKLKPSSVTRIDCHRKQAVKPTNPALESDYLFDNGKVKLVIDSKSGALVSYVVNGKELLGEGGIKFCIYDDTADSWALSKHQTQKMGNYKDEFKLMSIKESEEYCGFKGAFPVRIVEDGEITTCIESLLSCGNSTVSVRYYVMKETGAVYIKVRSLVNVPVSMLKMRIPCALQGKIIGQTAFSREYLMMDGQDTVSQRWIMCDDGENSLAIIKNGVYGSNYENNAINLSLTRTPVYCCHYVEGYDLTSPVRSYDHIDMNTNYFEFVLMGGNSEEINKQIEKTAKIFNERPYSINVFPVNEECIADFSDTVKVTGNVDCSTFKKNKEGDYILRLVNNSPYEEKSEVTVEKDVISVDFKPFEVKTFKYENKKIKEIQYMEI